MDHNLPLLLAVNRLPGNDGWLKRRIYDECRDTRDLEYGIAEYHVRRNTRSRGHAPVAGDLLRAAGGDLERMRYFGIDTRILGDPDYPVSLSRICDPPLVLFVRGRLDLESDSPVALVGTRRPSNPARRQAFALGLEFGGFRIPVVSGLAFGIDGAAHEGALASGGTTWAVLAGGLDRPGPKAHRRLASRILENGGALLGEIVPGGFPAKYAFPRRNRILSGLCRGCVVVQAPARSGALITAEFALDQNRDVYIASAGMEGALSDGTRNLESQGAPIVSSAADILRDWGRCVEGRMVTELEAPRGAGDLAGMMALELKGRLFRYVGGWFEYRGT